VNTAGKLRTHVGRLVFLGGLAAMLVLPSSAALAAGQPVTTAVDEGHQPLNDEMTPGQRRLMAKRAAEVRAVRDALCDTLGGPHPTSIQSGQITVRGKIAGFRVIESNELPDGRWRAVVEVTVPPAEARGQVDVLLTDYLQFRSAMMASLHRCKGHEARLQHELAEATEAIHTQIDAQLRACRADAAIIDRALADLEAKTASRLSALCATTSGPGR
jgi:hypothetical protein